MGLGISFPLRTRYDDVSARELAQDFGSGPFVAQAFTAELGQWVGPIESGFGWHLVKLSEHKPGRTLTFAEARSSLRDAWKAERKEQQAARRLEDLKRIYHIRREDTP